MRRTCGLIGDFIVNDISAGEDDPLMLPTVGELGLTYIAMHKRGTPQTMQEMTEYQDVVTEVRSYFDDLPEWGEGADFSPYYGDRYIGIDACCAYSGKINVLVLEDNFL